MIKGIFSVGFFTLLSRALGLVRDILLSFVMGASFLTDAFFIAFKLPNHFRSIFGEGAFNAAFIPTFTKLIQDKGKEKAFQFADNIFAFILLFQLVLLFAAWIFMPFLVKVLAPGFTGERLDLAISLTRITFPYLFFMSLVIMLSAILNSFKKYAAAAGAPILLNLSMITCMLLASYFVTPAHAAAYGIVISGLLQFLLVAFVILKLDAMPILVKPQVTPDVKLFWTKFVPAVLGSSGVAISLLADTIIASFLNEGIVSVLNYADRINQLPLGVIGIAVGTVLLSEMSSKIASGDEKGARNAQLRGIELTFLCTLPFLIAFTMIPEIIMKAIFMRGAFTEQNALDAASALAAYGIGLTAVMLIRSFVVTFQARGDLKTPLKCMLIATACNIALKIALIYPLQQVGIALATSLGAWVNWGLLTYFAYKQGLFAMDERARDSLLKIAFAGLALAFTLIFVDLALIKGLKLQIPDLLRLFILMTVGFVAYVGMLSALLGKQFLRDFKAIRAGKL